MVPEGEGKDRAVYATTIRSLEALAEAGADDSNPDAARYRHALELAKLCAFMAPEGVRFDLLTRGAPHLPPPLDAALADDIAFEEARETLANWSLARIGPVTLDVPEMLCRDAGIAQTAPGFGFHRLQQRVTREWLEQGGAWRATAEAVAAMVGGVFPFYSYPT